jgi:glycosyltransferase involved in cell wall biosynthesis
VREVVRDGETGLLADFHDIDEWCELANAVLDEPAAYRPLGAAGRAHVRDFYSTEVCLPQMRKLFRSVVDRAHPARKAASRPSRPALTLSGVAVG